MLSGGDGSEQLAVYGSSPDGQSTWKQSKGLVLRISNFTCGFIVRDNGWRIYISIVSILPMPTGYVHLMRLSNHVDFGYPDVNLETDTITQAIMRFAIS